MSSELYTIVPSPARLMWFAVTMEATLPYGKAPVEPDVDGEHGRCYAPE